MLRARKSNPYERVRDGIPGNVGFRNPALAAVAAILLFLTPAAAQASPPAFTDDAILQAIEGEFLTDPEVPFNPIDVTVVRGVVTLTGEVKSLMARDRAERLAETIKGVRSVVNRVEVEPRLPRTDEQVRRDVEHALLVDPATDSYEVGVKVNDGTAVLSGTVDSWQEKELVRRVAKTVIGVRRIDDRITVTHTRSRPDHEIQAEIAERMRWDALVDADLVNVEVDGSVARLTGTVGSVSEKRRAQMDAWVPGVTAVDASTLEVRDWAREPMKRTTRFSAEVTDAEIHEAVKDALILDPRVKGFNVDVHANNGVVTLRGVVDNVAASRSAFRDAQNTMGVIDVRNRLKIRPEARTEDEIESAVRSSLGRDPFLDAGTIEVAALGSEVTLTGVVDNFYEKARADETASEIAGVSDVRNLLAVRNVMRPLSFDPYVDPWYPMDYSWHHRVAISPTTSHTDARIAASIESQLWWSPFVDSDAVDVAVEDGRAILSGVVGSWSERAAATENAFDGGALWVDNQLEVRQ